jgi:outer membrane protein OmpA-like peptidoglycan-associated protein
MKKLLAALTAFLLMNSFEALSQVRMAIVGGPHQANVIESNSIPGWDTVVKPGYSKRKGFNLGILVDVPLSSGDKWSFQTGFIYHGKGREYFQQNDTMAIPAPDTSNFRNKFQTNYIDIPLNIAYRLKLGNKASFLVSAGPYVSFFYSGKQITQSRLFPTYKFEEKESPIEVGNDINKVKTLDLGVNARAGFEIGQLVLTGFYSRGLSSFYQASYDGKFNHELVGASVGFYLNKRKKPAPKKIEVVPQVVVVDSVIPTPPVIVETEKPKDTIVEPSIVTVPVEKTEITKEIIKKVDIAARQIYFNTGSDKLAPGSYAALDEVVGLLKENPSFTLSVEGHTDNTGKTAANLHLSTKRAEAVKIYLVSKGIEESRIKAEGYGETRPVAPNNTEKGRKANRRVELKLNS